MIQKIYYFFLTLVCFCFLAVQSAYPGTSVLTLDNLPKEQLSKFDCDHAMFHPDASMTSLQNNAVIPNNYYYPLIEWEGPKDYHDAYLVELKSGQNQLKVFLKNHRWRPEGNEFKPFLKGGEVWITLYWLGQGKTYQSRPLRLVISKYSINDRIAFRTVQPLFYPEAPNAIRIFSFDQRPLGILVELKGTCAGCHAYSAKLACFNIKRGNDRRLMILKQEGKKIQPGYQTLGELSFFTISPDGKYIVYVKKPDGDLVLKGTYIEPFDYPYRTGDLYCYDVERKVSAPLKGASTPEYVEDMPAFSPDGKFILFSRYQYEKKIWGQGVYAMDLYKVPFNDGNGGTPVPVRNASSNHQVQYFARYSPDGKWISFCRGDGQKGIYARKSSDIFLLSSDEKRCIKLNLNTDNAMDSWHSWSSDSHWLIFSSNREKGKITALYLVAIDENGKDSPPVKLFGDDKLKVNTPQFIPKNFDPGAAKNLKDYIDGIYSAVKK